MTNAVEPALFGASCFIFISYHFWIFYLRSRLPWGRKGKFLVWETSYKARAVWAEEVVADSRDALQTYGVQNLRNAITAASFMATTCALIAVQGLLTTFVDQTRVDRLQRISDNDPLAHGTWASPTLKLALTIGVVLFSFLCFMQSIRLMVHLGFLLRVVPCDRNKEHAVFNQQEAVGLALRSSACLTAGIRSFYAFIPLVMWMFGATALFFTTVIVTVMLYFTDDIPGKRPSTFAAAALGSAEHPAETSRHDVEQGIAGTGIDGTATSLNRGPAGSPPRSSEGPSPSLTQYVDAD